MCVAWRAPVIHFCGPRQCLTVSHNIRRLAAYLVAIDNVVLPIRRFPGCSPQVGKIRAAGRLCGT